MSNVLRPSQHILPEIHLPRKQRLINRKGHEVNESIDSYQLAIDYMEIRTNR